MIVGNGLFAKSNRHHAVCSRRVGGGVGDMTTRLNKRQRLRPALEQSAVVDAPELTSSPEWRYRAARLYFTRRVAGCAFQISCLNFAVAKKAVIAGSAMKPSISLSVLL